MTPDVARSIHDEELQVMREATLTCRWFLRCTNKADGTVSHPVLGSVPTCQRCATNMDQAFEQGIDLG